MAKAIAEPTGDKKCPVCGKSFFVQWPTLWTYKRGAPYPKYFCSYKCVREFDKNKEEKVVGKPRVISPENEQEAIKCATAGGDPIAYLKNCGAKNPSAAWYHIRSKIKDTDPETYEKLPHLYRKKTDTPKATLADAMEGMKDAADEFFGKCEDMGLSLGKDEALEEPKNVMEIVGHDEDGLVLAMKQPKITNPVVFDSMTVREVEGGFGRYRRSDVHGSIYLDFEQTDGADVISLTVKQWRSLREELNRAAAILGVEL